MASENLITAFHAKYYAYLLTRRHAANDVNRLSQYQSLFDASVDLNPHQIEAALFALRSPLSNALVTGTLPSGEKSLVIWRDVELVDYEALTRLCAKLAINPADSEFEVVYINGDHNIPAVFTSTEAEGGVTKTLKIRQIEPEFLSKMFATETV